VTPFFPENKVVVTGYPVRQGLHAMNRALARDQFGLAQDMPVLLVLGGSRGARSINEAVRGALPELLGMAQVVHITGPTDYAAMRGAGDGLPDPLRPRYRVYAYLYEEMRLALASADLAVARAGAATLGEFPAVGLPAILVPYPYAGPNQEVNARYLISRGAAEMVRDGDLASSLLPTVRALLGDAERLASMASAAQGLAVPGAAAAIAAQLADLARSGSGA